MRFSVWSGEPVNHEGRHFRVRDMALLPGTVQRPRPQVWTAGFWPNRPPMRRAARWDGAVPLFASAKHGHAPPVEEVRDLVAYIGRRRGEGERSFETVLGGVSPSAPAEGHDLNAVFARGMRGDP